MEQLPRKIGATSIDAVARDGVAEVLEVNPDLVCTPRFRAAFEQAEFSVRGEQLPGGFRRARLGPVGNGHAFTVHRMPSNGARDDAGRCTRLAADDGEVSFLRRALGELACQSRVGRIVLGHEDATARVLV